MSKEELRARLAGANRRKQANERFELEAQLEQAEAEAHYQLSTRPYSWRAVQATEAVEALQASIEAISR